MLLCRPRNADNQNGHEAHYSMNIADCVFRNSFILLAPPGGQAVAAGCFIPLQRIYLPL